MDVQRASLREALVADDAAVRLLARVRAKVYSEAVRLEKSLVADVTNMRFLLVVHTELVAA